MLWFWREIQMLFVNIKIVLHVGENRISINKVYLRLYGG